MKGAPVSEARRIGRAADADGVLIIAVRGEEFSATTYGRDASKCAALRMWAAGYDVDMLAEDMAAIVADAK